MSEQINRNSSICQGIVYGVGTGPGDPELMTLKAVQNCGLAGERTYCGLEEIPEDAGYFLIVLAGNECKN